SGLVDRLAVDVIGQGLYAATHSTNGTSSTVFSSFPVPIAGKTGPAEKGPPLPGSPPDPPEDHPWGGGGGPAGGTASQGHGPIVVCAVIENGGHGSTAAAPAALEVFSKWFGVKAQQQTQVVKTD